MSAPAARFALAAALALGVGSVASVAQNQTQSQRLVVHEWGTFTTVAGQDGQAVEWLPLGGQQDLPCFVNHFQSQREIKIVPGAAPPLTYDEARRAVRGTVRMETPVLYFYADREVWTSVSVGFPQGLMTEWYPQASVSQPDAFATILKSGGRSQITWANVRVRPGGSGYFPQDGRPSHYYAARQTDAAPLSVNNNQDEKFLFYRGVGGFGVPLSSVVTSDGKVQITNTGASTIRGVVLFENRGGRLGYRVVGDVKKTTTIDPPALTSDLASLGRDLERLLVSTGLYEKEAHAMVETWRDSWFEPGTRIFYLVPNATVDAILPLNVTPRPTEVVRAFVGRAELITDATIREVSDAIAESDQETLAPYARFLEPIAARITASMPAFDRAKTGAALSAAYTSYVARAVSYCR
jgi:hypothetical protein